MKKAIMVALLLLTLTLGACVSRVQATPTVIPIATFTAIPATTQAPTPTLLAATETEAVVSGLVPQGQPATEWQGIPIMPGAIAGDGDEEGYVFTVQATAQQVQEYYDGELGKSGWHVLAQGKGEKASLILMYTNDASETLSISIIAKGDESLVLLVK